MIHRIRFFLFSAIAGLHAWTLLRYPAPFTDEGWLANRAWAYKFTGKAFGPADSGVLDRFDGYWTYFQWLPTWFRSLSLQFVDVPSLLLVRIVSIFFGFLLLAAVYAIGRRLGGRALGFLGALLVSISPSFLYSSHLARDDIFAAFFGYTAIALYILNRTSGRIWRSFLSGLCLGFAFEIHPHSAIFIPAIAGLYLIDQRRNLLRHGPAWGFGMGVATGLLFYLERHVLRYPGTYSTLSELFFLDTHTPPLLTLDPGILYRAFIETGLLLFNQYQVLLPAVIWAGVTCLNKSLNRPVDLYFTKQNGQPRGPFILGTSTSILLLTLNFLLLLGLTLFVRNKFNHYAVLITPALDLTLAAYILHYIRLPWQGHLQDYMVRAACGLLFISTLFTVRLLLPNPLQAYQRTQSQIRPLVLKEDRIMGPPTYWFDLYDHHFTAWEQLVIFSRYAPDSTLEQAFRELDPDLLIIDENMEIFISDQVKDTPFLAHFRLPKTGLFRFLEDHGELLLTYDDPGWPEVKVYRIHWDQFAESGH